MSLFDLRGRCIPSPGMRLFQATQGEYYKIKSPIVDHESILFRLKKFNHLSHNLSLIEFNQRADQLISKINADENYTNILNGPHIPFICQADSHLPDLGENLDNILLPQLHNSFVDKFPGHHFKSVNQAGTSLNGKIKLEPSSRYANFIQSAQKKPVVGWYFPQALQEFDIASQRAQISILPEIANASLCLSGALDVCSALIGMPELLINSENYSPILCLSSYVHDDPRLVLLLKAYGARMEFWCMSQMLMKGITQVSEQWSGGITIFELI
jgi:hypothetical protein